MSNPRQILAVDERRTTLDFLRSVLSLVEDDIFEVSGVPSGEEGLLELRRKRYDLLLSGVRLPGIDGLELARRARQLWPDIPVILASARPPAELRDEAAALGVSHFLSKPLDAEEFLAAVREALGHAPPADSSPPPEEPEARRYLTALPKAVEARLETLCAETGAGQVLLVTVGGKLLLATGSQSYPELPRLVAATATSVGYSLHLSDQLDDQEPRMVQFLEGERYDLYWASVDRDYFIIILFDAQIRRGRIGTVWVFAQRAANELKILLARLPKHAGSDRPVSQSTPRRKRPGSADSQAEDGQDEAPASDDSAPDDSPQPAETIAESPPEAVEPAHDPKIDAFWDEALADESGADYYTSAISLEEAREKGLIAEDFDPEDQY